MLQWHPHLDPLACAALALAAGAGVYASYRRLARRLTPLRARLVLAPRVATLALLLVAMFDPARVSEHSIRASGRLVVLLDTSSSMDVADKGIETRLARGRALMARIERALPAGVRLDGFEFDTRLRPVPAGRPAPRPGAGPIRETDLKTCLEALADRPDIANARGVVLLTDGGDEPLASIRVPDVPLTVVGIGGDPAAWRDIAITALRHPATAEQNTTFTVEADLATRTGVGADGARAAADIPLALEREERGAWQSVETSRLNLSRKRATASFSVTEAEVGPHRYRITANAIPGEISALNNSRVFDVDIGRKSIRVLYFARELGAEFKMLRSELARDPGIAFTALFRTLSERFTVQGDRIAGDEDLEAGFPSRDTLLRPYDCVIMGSFPAADWSADQMRALVQYVEAGGTVVFLGGEDSFGLGGYAGTPLAPLLPWPLSRGEPDLARGSYPVVVPPVAGGHAIVAGLSALLAESGAATIESVNQPGPLRASATPLIQSTVSGRPVAVAAVHPVGRGRVLAIASNTLWKWARNPGPLKAAYGLFWRQAVRDLAGRTEGGRVIAVRWDRDRYAPGDEARAEIRIAGDASGGAVRLEAAVQTGGVSRAIQTERSAGDAAGYTLKVRFEEAGEYGVRLVAYRADAVAEAYERTFRITQPAREGSALALDHEALDRFARQAGGRYWREAEADEFLHELESSVRQDRVTTEISLIHGRPWFFATVLALLLGEWAIRRRMNLV